MSGFLYRGRHYGGSRKGMAKSRSNTLDLSGAETEKGPPLQSHSLREFEQHLNDLKKENFSLKLRIYFLEEKIQQKFEHSESHDVHRKNIELKVELESLKQELQERQQQLDEAISTTAQSQNEEESQWQREEMQQEVDEGSVRSEAEETHCPILQRRRRRRMEGREDEEVEQLHSGDSHLQILAEKQRLVEELRERVTSKEEEVKSLNEDRVCLRERVRELEDQLHVLNKDNNHKILQEDFGFEKKHKQLEMQKLIGEQQVQLVQYEQAAGQCVSELQKAQLQVQSLQSKIRESESSNKKLQLRLQEMESELRSVRDAADGQERMIQNLSDSLSTRDSEVADLQQLVEEQKELLRSLKQRNLQVCVEGPAAAQVELVELQSALFSAQLELQVAQRAERRAHRREDELNRASQRLLSHLQGALQRHHQAQQHNQDLQVVLERVRAELEQVQDSGKEGAREKDREMEEVKRSIRELRSTLEHKDRLLQDYSELVDGQSETGGNRDALIHKLKQRIQERDRALERVLEQKFVCVEQKEEELHKLQLLLREKERDLDKLRCVINNNQETITSLEAVVRGKSVELEQVNEAWRNVQQMLRQTEDTHAHSLRDRDTLISQLQSTLHARSKEAEELSAALLSKVCSGGDVVEDLRWKLQLKERLLQEVLSDRSRQLQEQQEDVQELLAAISTRDQYIKDSAQRAAQVVSEQAARLQELRRQVSGAGNGAESSADLQRLRDELQLAVVREREVRSEVTTLQSALTHLQQQLHTQTSQLQDLNRIAYSKDQLIKDLQVQLVEPSSLPLVERLMQELEELKQRVSHQEASSSGHQQVEPERQVSMETERTAGSWGDAGDCVSDEDDDDDDECISEFVDSTEEEENSKLTAQSLSRTQDGEQRGGCVAVEAQGLVEVKLLVEQKRAVEKELRELKTQLQKSGFSSLSHMRKALLSLRSENEELQSLVRRGEAGADKTGVATVQTQTQTQHHGRPTLTETVVQQNSKQVQVDLQDLGYETCGRSENEAERDDTSSPEFDDLELCTSLSCRDGASQWWSGSGRSLGNEASALQRQVDELRGQLSRSQALVLKLQARLRETMPTSSPRRVSWGQRGSGPGQSGGEEDEGWQSSDGYRSLTQHSLPDSDLQQLVARVASLEEQLRKGKGHTQEVKSSNWPGKFDALVQAQARELCHLRQRLREGRSVCRDLTQQLAESTKAFEELLQSNDVEYSTGQSFRHTLAHCSSLAHSLAHSINTRDNADVSHDKMDHHPTAERLRKELQQKDKLIESLRSKLTQQQQPRSDTPTSSHALSEATDQSEHASYVSDEQGSTNEDLDLCSELDAASEFGQEEATERSVSGSYHSQGFAPSHASIPSSHTSYAHQSSSGCPSMHCTPLRLTEGQMQTGFSGGPSKPISAFPLGSSPLPDPGSFPPLSHQPFPPSPLASLGASPALKLGAGHLDSGALWDMTYGARPVRGGAYGDVSSGSSGYQSGVSRTGTDLMEEHLREIRSLRQRLEDSIQTNDRLRQQLEEKLTSKSRDGGGAPTNIYIQGLDSVTQLSNAVQILKEENRALQTQLQQTSRDSMQEAERLREAVLSGRGKLKQAELEAEKWAEQYRQLQVQMREQMQAALQLKQDRQSSQDNVNRLQHEVSVLQQQLRESRRLVHTLQTELQVYQKVSSTSRSMRTGAGQSLTSDLEESQCHLRLLEQQLSDRLNLNTHSCARRHLFHDLSPSPPVRDTGPLSPAEPDDGQSCPEVVPGAGVEESEVPLGCFACRTGRYVVARADDFSTLKQRLLEGRGILRKTETMLLTSTGVMQEGGVWSLLSSTKSLMQIQEEASSLLKMFWRAELPTVEELQKEQSLRAEVVSLRQKVSQKEQALRDTMETLRSANRTKDSMELFITSQLSRTRDVLKKARTNLEIKTQTSPAAPLTLRVS